MSTGPAEEYFFARRAFRERGCRRRGDYRAGRAVEVVSAVAARNLAELRAVILAYKESSVRGLRPRFFISRPAKAHRFPRGKQEIWKYRMAKRPRVRFRAPSSLFLRRGESPERHAAASEWANPPRRTVSPYTRPLFLKLRQVSAPGAPRIKKRRAPEAPPFLCLFSGFCRARQHGSPFTSSSFSLSSSFITETDDFSILWSVISVTSTASPSASIENVVPSSGTDP